MPLWYKIDTFLITIGLCKETAIKIDYYLFTGGMIGFWDKSTKKYIAIGKGGSGVKV